MKKIIWFVLLFVLGQSAFATHNLAGDITYRHISGLTYEFTVTIFSDGNSPAISRREIEINWGDGTRPDSLIIVQQTEVGIPGENIFKRVWRGTHTFAGGGFTYTIRVVDPNRNAGVVNIDNGNSVNVPFTIESRLTISPFGPDPNNSVQLRNDPLDDACIGARYVYNPGAFDPDGDSIAYKIARSKGTGGMTAPNYTFPSASNSISVDPITGDLIWDSPNVIGIHNVAILIEEYRAGELIGSVLRDIQVIVIPGCDNTPPTIFADQLVCVEAGQTLTTNISSSDADVNDDITLSATGEVLEAPINARTNFNVGVIDNPTNASFIWNTLCEDVRIQTYALSIKAEDNGSVRGPTNLVNFKTLNIRVISPGPRNASAVSVANSINLNWTNTDCQNATGYYIYRRLGFSGFIPSDCNPGVPNGIGYEKIAELNDVSITSFTDNNNGLGLVPGQQYCYLITKSFSDGDESYASDEVCAEIDKVVPVITNVSIDSTNESTGRIELAWSPPSIIDPVDFPPPYRYLIYDLSLGDDNSILLDSTLSLNDTTFTLDDRNTVDNASSFRVDLYSYGNGKTFAGRSVEAGSIFLNITPTDNLLQLNWTEDVPWSNDEYTIFRKLPSSATFDSIGTTSNQFYNDSNLINGVEYCYYVRSNGGYNLNDVIDPIINLSQEACERPIDNVPPCSPEFEISSDCDMDELTIRWNNLNNSCADDIQGYNIYKATNRETELVLIDTRNNPMDTVYQTNNDSIAGCYVITAVDSTGNESVFSDRKCVDYCPIYELPNVFTPNGDGKNDIFIPITPFKYVDSIHIVIYNRWGEMVFESNNPSINWDGTHHDIRVEAINESLANSGKMVSAGVYFYVCEVFEFSLEPSTKPRILNGTITIFDPQPINEKD